MKQRLQQWRWLSWPKIVVPSLVVGVWHPRYDLEPSCSRVSRSVKAWTSLSTVIPTLLARLYFSPTVTLTEGAAATVTCQTQTTSLHSIPWPTTTTTVPKDKYLATTAPSLSTTTTHPEQQHRNYDFVVVGHGTAGRSAVTTLQQVCPTAKIAVVDPLRCPTGGQISHSLTKPTSATAAANGHVDYYAARATGLCTDDKTVQIVSTLPPTSAAETVTTASDSDDDAGVVVALQYMHALLIATGARGAPPPHYLVDGPAAHRVVELHSTALGGLVLRDDQDTVVQEDSVDADSQPTASSPFWSPDQVRQHVHTWARAGQAVAVLGSGWEAVDLVALLAVHGSRRRKQAQTTSTTASLVFGAAGPLSHVLPHYLSRAVSKRLQSLRIQVLDRSLVRYIGHHNGGHPNKTHNSSPRLLQLYTAKSFDFLDGATTAVDWIVVAPAVQGARGNAALATDQVPQFLRNNADHGHGPPHRPWYQTWDQVSQTRANVPSSRLVCYADDGRLAANTELAVCRGVYAAGSAAKYANGWTGHATVAGYGVVDGTDAGRVAALNMAQEYTRAQSVCTTWSSVLGGEPYRSHSHAPAAAVKDPIPVWRSDLRTTNGSARDQHTMLAEIGIVALCVGHCDSESLSTHGVWWTNQAAQQRLWRLLEHETSATQKPIANTLSQSPMKQRQKPVYGMGVVYYLDRMGRVRGVMTWGLPFQRNHVLNERLVKAMKQVIESNGGFPSLETEQDNVQMSRYLTQTSHDLLVTAFQGGCHDGKSKEAQGELSLGASLARPLHRFTDIRPPHVRSVGLFKRKNGRGHGVLGEDLFTGYDFDDIPDAPFPSPSTRSHPHHGPALGSAAAKVEAQYVWNVWEQHERRWDENYSRARPPKEDLLWIRKGDEARSTSQSERLSTAYRNALQGGTTA
jgi:Pyridine nucleotide-disulphide oxidoreductase